MRSQKKLVSGGRRVSNWLLELESGLLASSVNTMNWQMSWLLGVSHTSEGQCVSALTAGRELVRALHEFGQEFGGV